MRETAAPPSSNSSNSAHTRRATSSYSRACALALSGAAQPARKTHADDCVWPLENLWQV
eukprot:CAMPEP_0173088662 /NCGR_PEP_ID=MMETSP1102-20130122/25155_1 /TAXON_ID=49646 /ORGANISM="Geminigera sp., Strain Caron Lab Isolate" /LENGTH=58 /DNA_ID=CAMNT_0013971783 /DNA_START=926 /DNA_END=1102 /DNA_ORIENTATION=-